MHSHAKTYPVNPHHHELIQCRHYYSLCTWRTPAGPGQGPILETTPTTYNSDPKQDTTDNWHRCKWTHWQHNTATQHIPSGSHTLDKKRQHTLTDLLQTQPNDYKLPNVVQKPRPYMVGTLWNSQYKSGLHPNPPEISRGGVKNNIGADPKLDLNKQGSPTDHIPVRCTFTIPIYMQQYPQRVKNNCNITKTK